MATITRRASMAGMAGLAGVGAMAQFSRSVCATAASSWTVPPEGIGNRIKHVSWSDQGGRLDGVQIMLNRQHLYIGHQFTDGFRVLDASDPRNIKPVKYILTGAEHEHASSAGGERHPAGRRGRQRHGDADL